MMRKTMLLLLAVMLGRAGLKAQDFTPKDDSSSVQFRINNFGIPVKGDIHGLTGSIHYEADSLGVCAFSVSVETGTINTGIDMRDNHLKSADFFDATRFPSISFVSTKVTPSTRQGYLFIFGNLTIRDVTKAVSFPFQVAPHGNGYLFTGSFTLNRKDYGVGGSSLTMGDQVTVDLSVLALPALKP